METIVVVRNGAQGSEVEKLQNRLKELGFYEGEVDGQFGNGTRAAVVLFQTQHGLQADGIVGPATQELIYSSQAQQIIVTPTPDPSSSFAAATPILVNRDNLIPENYKTRNLIYLRDECPSDLVTIKGSEIQGEKEAVDALIVMLQAAHTDGIKDWQVSAGYRSVAYQQELFDQQVAAYIADGRKRSDAISATSLTVADPGASEHHTGLAFDITTPGTTFKGTPQALWLSAHCWEYGFIIRYEEDKQKITGFLAEPWHIRYVGLPHSTIIRDHAWCLEEYLDSLSNK
jgi:LAS superfamily LD-carboxypeptidase LdcB